MDYPSKSGVRNGLLTRRAVLGGLAGTVTGLSGCVVRGVDSGLSGEIRVDGSNTVLPHAAAVSEEFQWRNNRVQVPVRGSGTGAGFQRFCSGETHAQNASREILSGEVTECDRNGIEYLSLEVVLDGIAILAHPNNDWCECLTVEELHEIWRSGSTIETWADVRSEWPDEEIDLYGRDPASGTFDYFTEAINGEIGNIRSDYAASSDTNVIVRGVRGNRNTLGFGGAGYYYENADRLKLIGVDDGDGCVKPTRETIEDGTYRPLTRGMYLYLRRDRLEREVFRAFAHFYFEEIDEAADDDVVDPGETLTWTQWAARKVGFYAIPNELVEANREMLEAAIEEGR